MERIRLNRAFFYLALLIAATTVVLSMLGEVFIKATIETVLPPGEGTVLGYIVVIVLLFSAFLPLAALTSRQAGRVLGVEVSAASADRQPALPFLVMGYSPLRGVKVEDLIREVEKLTPDVVADTVPNFDEACKNAEYTPVSTNFWQQNLRSAWHHREKIKAIYVLDPDRDQFEDLKLYLTTAFSGSGRTVEVHQITEYGIPNRPFSVHDDSGQQLARTYENYSYVYEGLRRGLQMIRERKDLDQIIESPDGFSRRMSRHEQQDHIDRLTCIDATPGQKSFSIAAAVLTLNRPLKFSYVTTASSRNEAEGSPERVGGEVRFYDTSILIAGT